MAHTNMQQSKKRKHFQKEENEIHITARYISSYRHEIKHVLEANTVFAGGVDLIVAYSDVTLLTLSHRFLNKLYQKWYPTMILPSGAEPLSLRVAWRQRTDRQTLLIIGDERRATWSGFEQEIGTASDCFQFDTDQFQGSLLTKVAVAHQFVFCQEAPNYNYVGALTLQM